MSSGDQQRNGRLQEHIMVTGGAGYIGSTLIALLLERGYEVTCFDCFLWGMAPLLSMAANPKLHIFKGDITSKTDVQEAVKGKTGIVHLAAIVGYPACDKDQALATAINVDGTRNLLEAKDEGTSFVYASTGSCYGAVEGICTEETSICPLSHYGSTKAQAEQLVLEKGGVALRLATVFGLSARLRLDLLINDLTYKALTLKEFDLYEGHFRRTFIHVKDAARGFLFALENHKVMQGKAFNLGDERWNMTKNDVVKIIRERVPTCNIIISTTGQDKDKRDYEVSFKKIKALGFHCVITVEESITNMVKVLPNLLPDEVLRCKNV